jgi:hypothetical protein
MLFSFPVFSMIFFQVGTKSVQQQVNKMKPSNVFLGSQAAGCCGAISDLAGTGIPALLI